MISLVAAKLYLRVDFNDDDTDIDRMIAAASDHLKSIGIDVDADPLPPAVEQAVLMLVAHFYENREAITNSQRASLDFGVDRLIAPHREHGI